MKTLKMTTAQTTALAAQYAPALAGTVALVSALLRMLAALRLAVIVRCQRMGIISPIMGVPVLGWDDCVSRVPAHEIQLADWTPTVAPVHVNPVPETFNRDGYTVPVALPVKPVRKTPVRKGKPAKQAAQTVERETPVVQSRKSKASKPVVPVLPDAPTGRKELQALAKANGIKANLASAVIIDQLREKGIVA